MNTLKHNIEAWTVDRIVNTFSLKCPCCGKFIIDVNLISKLYKIEKLIKITLRGLITSAYRCVSHNDAVGGVMNSYHTQGKAIDIYTGDELKTQRLVKAARLAGFKRIGWRQYNNVFVHVDVGEYPSPAEW